MIKKNYHKKIIQKKYRLRYEEKGNKTNKWRNWFEKKVVVCAQFSSWYHPQGFQPSPPFTPCNHFSKPSKVRLLGYFADLLHRQSHSTPSHRPLDTEAINPQSGAFFAKLWITQMTISSIYSLFYIFSPFTQCSVLAQTANSIFQSRSPIWDFRPPFFSVSSSSFLCKKYLRIDESWFMWPSNIKNRGKRETRVKRNGWKIWQIFKHSILDIKH